MPQNHLKMKSNQNYSKYKNYEPPFPFNKPYSTTVLSKLRRIVKFRAIRALNAKTIRRVIAVDEFKMTSYTNLSKGSTKNLYLLPGYLGNNNSSYMLSALLYYANKGWNIHRINPVDHGDTLLMNKKFFNALHHEITSKALEKVVKDHAGDHYLMGFSFGGNFALRIAMLDMGVKFKRVVAISPMIDHENSLEQLPLFFQRYYNKKWVKTFKAKETMWEDQDFKKYYKMRDLKEMMKEWLPFVLPEYDFNDLSDFFEMYKISVDKIQQLKTQASIIMSADDPVVPIDSAKHLQKINNINFLQTKFGGHNSFTENFSFDDYSMKIAASELGEE